MAEVIRIKHDKLLSGIGDMTFSEITNKYSQLFIPESQRKYEWTTSQITDLIEDIQGIANTKDDLHFMNMITVGRDDDKYWLVDGQQRMTTICLIVAAIRDLYRTYQEELSKKGIQFPGYDTIPGSAESLLKKSGSDSEFFIVLKHYNNDFQSLLKMTQPPKSADLDLDSIVIKAYWEIYSLLKKYFGDVIQEDGTSTEKPLKTLKQFFNTLQNRLIFVCCELNPEANINRIFAATNSRGLALMPADKLKSLFMEKYESLPEKDNFSGKWNEIYNYFENSKDMTRFVNMYWDARKEYVSEKSLLKSIRDDIKQEDSDYVDSILQELKSSVEVYKSISSGGMIIGKKDARLIMAIKNCSINPIKTHHPIIIAAVVKGYSDSNLAALIEDLNVFNTREILAKTKSNERKSFFDSLASEIYKGLDYQSAHNRIVEKQCPTSVFMENAVLKSKDDAISKYILGRVYCLDNGIDLSKDDNIEVEHIYPQKPPKKNCTWHGIGNAENKYLLGNQTFLTKEDNKKALNRCLAFKLLVYSLSNVKQTKAIYEEFIDNNQVFREWIDSYISNNYDDKTSLADLLSNDKDLKKLNKACEEEQKKGYLVWNENNIKARNKLMIGKVEEALRLS